MHKLYLEIINQLGIPQIVGDIIWPIFPFICIAILMVFVVIFLVLMERKVLAILTIRKGPNRVGPYGCLQTFADAIKLLFKEDIMPCGSNKILFTVGPIIFFAPVMVVYGLVPFGENLLAIDISIGLFAILALSSINTIGIILAGWASNNKYSLLGGIRSAAQAISYEIPLVICALSIVVLAGSMNMHSIVYSQDGNILHWNIWPAFIGFIVFFICSIAEINRIPFDLPEAESELVSGYNTEYSGMKFALFFLAEYAALFIISVVISTLFLGGYNSPFNDYMSLLLFKNSISNTLVLDTLVQLEQVFWIALKTYTIIFIMMWIRATLPRLRADKLMPFCWKFLLPLAFINLFIVAIYRHLMPIN